MIREINFLYEDKNYELLDCTIFDNEFKSPTTIIAAGKNLQERLLDKDGNYISKDAKRVDELVSYFLSDNEMKKSLECIECILFCEYNKLKYISHCHYKDMDGLIKEYKPYKPEYIMIRKRQKTENGKQESTRSVDYIPQPGHKATLKLADFTDENIFAELRKRGYSGELKYFVTLKV